MSKYLSKPLEDWNTRDFHSYMSDKHMEMFGIPYQPYINWGAERGMLGTFIGTKKKSPEVSKAVAKRFIDKIFEEHKPTEKFPGVNFGSNYSHRKYLIQQASMEVQRAGGKLPEQKADTKEVEPEVDEALYQRLSELL